METEMTIVVRAQRRHDHPNAAVAPIVSTSPFPVQAHQSQPTRPPDFLANFAASKLFDFSSGLDQKEKSDVTKALFGVKFKKKESSGGGKASKSTPDTAEKTAKLAEKIRLRREQGQSSVQAVGCPAAGVLAEEVIGKVGKGALLAGIPAYSAAILADPAVAASVPTVAMAFPRAYEGVGRAAKAAGQFVEKKCDKILGDT